MLRREWEKRSMDFFLFLILCGLFLIPFYPLFDSFLSSHLALCVDIHSCSNPCLHDLLFDIHSFSNPCNPWFIWHVLGSVWVESSSQTSSNIMWFIFMLLHIHAMLLPSFILVDQKQRWCGASCQNESTTNTTVHVQVDEEGGGRIGGSFRPCRFRPTSLSRCCLLLSR